MLYCWVFKESESSKENSQVAKQLEQLIAKRFTDRTLKIAYQTQSYEDRSEKIKILITESREIQKVNES